MRTLAIDLGTRRIGLAMSDEAGTLAGPYDVLDMGEGGTVAMEAIISIIRREAVGRVVVGVPLNMDETIGPGARKAFQWGRLLSDRDGVPVVFVDERLSSFAAEQTLIERKRQGEKLTRKRKKEKLDALAAAGFLQEFLDGKLQPIEDLRS
jgi:putative Holliday junction resolvase